jgi:hypothetical protein
MNELDISAQDAMATGGRLSGQRMLAARTARAGGNNRVFCLDTTDGTRFALKYYPSQAIDGRDRLSQEYEALTFLARHGITSTPRAIARDTTENCALYEWLDGEAVVEGAQQDDVDQLAGFVIALQKLRRAEGAAGLRDASASIFSPLEAVAQYRRRLDRLRQVEREHPDLRSFIERSLIPTGAAAIRRFELRYTNLGWDPGTPLASAHRALSPSDFGMHNALRGRDGQLRFVDFEYFGWDDPVKLVSDTAIHPGSNFAEGSRRLLVERLSREFEADDPAFTVRRDAMYPVFGMIWCLIILNDYLPESRSRRVFAARRDDLENRLAGQLDKARRLHQTICERDPDLAPR